MFDRIEDIIRKYEDISMELNEPSVISDQDRFRKLMKEQKSLEPLVECYNQYKKCKETMEESLMMLDEESDPDMKEMLKEELANAKDMIPELENRLKILLLPKDPNDDKNVIVEIRAGVGGDEAALFAADMYRLYTRYAERQNWRVETMSVEDIGIGGIKTVSFMIKGNGAYSRLKFESGVHRVQRVPETEAQGRIHTSTVTVAVLPEVEEVDVEINPDDVRMEVFRASGAGGQHINKTSSAVRLIHEPTGLVAECQTERSQMQNRENAMKMLRSRLYAIEKEKQDKEITSARRSMVGSGDRSEKIRTYNYPQGRITDHRVGYNIYQFENFLNGDMDELIDNLIATDQAERLQGDHE